MNSLQKWCKDNLHVIEASANGEVVQIKPTGCEQWVDIDCPCFRGDLAYEYRIKPRTIKIGDFDVPEPMREAPNGGVEVFSPMPASQEMYWSWPWWGSKADFLALNRGVVHCNMDSAVAHSIAIISLTEPK